MQTGSCWQASILSSIARHVGLCLQDNIIHGRFLAELTQEVVSDLEVGLLLLLLLLQGALLLQPPAAAVCGRRL